jgi:hypothetical protein
MTRLSLVFLASMTAVAAAQAPGIRVVRDQADAALAILQRSGAPTEADWDALTRSEGYRRLLRREAAMGRPLTDSAFRSFLLSDTMARRAPLLARTLEEWSRADAGAAARLALAYLPSGTRLQATVYPLIKPRVNSFVFDTGTDSAAIFLYLDPAVSRAKLQNTIAHELHHLGYAAACAPPADSALPERVRTTRRWMGAFGEGLAMLAAAGGTGAHPHAASDSAERARWERDYAKVDEDLQVVQRLLDGVDGNYPTPSSNRSAAHSPDRSSPPGGPGASSPAAPLRAAPRPPARR